MPGTVRRGAVLRFDEADPGVPVGQCGAGAAATAERGGFVLGQGAGLADVLAGGPDVLAVDGGGAVVAPAWPGRGVERLVAGEPVLGSGAGLGEGDAARAGT